MHCLTQAVPTTTARLREWCCCCTLLVDAPSWSGRQLKFRLLHLFGKSQGVACRLPGTVVRGWGHVRKAGT